MAHFRKIVSRLMEMIQNFKDGDINIVICNLSLDSLIAAFVMKYYILCVRGNNRHVKIFCDDSLDNPLLQSICGSFNLPCNREIKNISDIINNGNNIFINWGSDIGEKNSNIKPSIVIGDVCEEIMHPSDDKEIIDPSDDNIVFLGGYSISISAIMFKIFCETGYIQSLKRDKNLAFLLALAIRHDTNRIITHASHNQNVLGRIVDFIGFHSFHVLIDRLPEDVRRELKLD